MSKVSELENRINELEQMIIKTQEAMIMLRQRSDFRAVPLSQSEPTEYKDIESLNLITTDALKDNVQLLVDHPEETYRAYLSQIKDNFEESLDFRYIKQSNIATNEEAEAGQSTEKVLSAASGKHFFISRLSGETAGNRPDYAVSEEALGLVSKELGTVKQTAESASQTAESASQTAGQASQVANQALQYARSNDNKLSLYSGTATQHQGRYQTFTPFSRNIDKKNMFTPSGTRLVANQSFDLIINFYLLRSWTGASSVTLSFLVNGQERKNMYMPVPTTKSEAYQASISGVLNISFNAGDALELKVVSDSYESIINNGQDTLSFVMV
ncbi:alanine-zipper protein [Vibrio cholerae]